MMMQDDKKRKAPLEAEVEPAEDSRGNSIVQAAYSAAEVAGAEQPEVETVE